MNINALTFDKQRQNKMITVTTAVESSSFVPIAQSIRFPQTLISERSGHGEDTPPVGQKNVLLKATGDKRPGDLLWSALGKVNCYRRAPLRKAGALIDFHRRASGIYIARFFLLIPYNLYFICCTGLFDISEGS